MRSTVPSVEVFKCRQFFRFLAPPLGLLGILACLATACTKQPLASQHANADTDAEKVAKFLAKLDALVSVGDPRDSAQPQPTETDVAMLDALVLATGDVVDETIAQAGTADLEYSAAHQFNLAAYGAQFPEGSFENIEQDLPMFQIGELTSDWGKSPIIQQALLMTDNPYSRLLIFTLMGAEIEVEIAGRTINNHRAVEWLSDFIEISRETWDASYKVTGVRVYPRFPLGIERTAARESCAAPPNAETAEEGYQRYLNAFSFYDNKNLDKSIRFADQAPAKIARWLRSFLHDLPGLFVPIVKASDGVFNQYQFTQLFNIIWLHNGPMAGFWGYFVQSFIAPFHGELLRHTTYGGPNNKKATVIYPPSPTAEGQLSTLIDRFDQTMLTGILKIVAELRRDSDDKDTPESLYYNAVVNNISGTQAQLAMLRDIRRAMGFDIFLPGVETIAARIDHRVALLKAYVETWIVEKDEAAPGVVRITPPDGIEQRIETAQALAEFLKKWLEIEASSAVNKPPFQALVTPIEGEPTVNQVREEEPQ